MLRTQRLVTGVPWCPSVVCYTVIAPPMLYNLMPHMGRHSVTGRSYNGSHAHKCHGMYSVDVTCVHNCTSQLVLLSLELSLSAPFLLDLLPQLQLSSHRRDGKTDVDTGYGAPEVRANQSPALD